MRGQEAGGAKLRRRRRAGQELQQQLRRRPVAGDGGRIAGGQRVRRGQRTDHRDALVLQDLAGLAHAQRVLAGGHILDDVDAERQHMEFRLQCFPQPELHQDLVEMRARGRAARRVGIGDGRRLLQRQLQGFRRRDVRHGGAGGHGQRDGDAADELPLLAAEATGRGELRDRAVAQDDEVGRLAPEQPVPLRADGVEAGVQRVAGAALELRRDPFQRRFCRPSREHVHFVGVDDSAEVDGEDEGCAQQPVQTIFHVRSI